MEEEQGRGATITMDSGGNRGDHSSDAPVCAPANRAESQVACDEGDAVQRVMFRRVNNRRTNGKQEFLSGETLLQVVQKLEDAGGDARALSDDRPAGQGSDDILLGAGAVSVGATESTQCYMGLNRAIENRATVNLSLMKWDGRPQCVLIVEKSGDTTRYQTGESKRLPHVTVRIIERICRYCHYNLKLDVIVEERVQRELPTCTFLTTCDQPEFMLQEPRTAMPKTESDVRSGIAQHLRHVDFCIAIGHDGAVVQCAGLFDRAIPPVLPIALHHAGIMARIHEGDAEEMLSTVVNNEFHLGMRVRLRCSLYSFKTGETQVIHALNDLVMDRGPSPFLTSVECYCNDRLITLVQGDGLIIATPTGSTAYSQAAGGAMVHPDVPCVLFTPLNPHSLSFRPLVLPNSITLRLQLTPNARSVAWVCFDGRNRQPLCQGDKLEVTVAHWPVPIIQTGKEDWVDGCNSFLSSMVRDFVSRFRLRPAL